MLLLHVTALLVAVAGIMLAVKVSVLPMVMLVVDLSRDTLVTAMVPPPVITIVPACNPDTANQPGAAATSNVTL
jgi:hypothetical protein